MFRIPAARTAMVVVILASIAGAVLRVVTAADRVRDRRDTARSSTGTPVVTRATLRVVETYEPSSRGV